MAGVHVYMPESAGDPVVLECGGERPIAFPRQDPPTSLRADRIWAELATSPDPGSLLDAYGTALGQWLLGSDGVALLNRTRGRDGTCRISLHLKNDRLSGWPWELAHAPELRAAIGIDDDFSVVRVLRGDPPSPRAREVMLVGIDYDETSGYQAIQTGDEVEAIRQTLLALEPDRIDPEMISTGRWSSVVARITSSGPPAVFHFAGHAAARENALVFRNDSNGYAQITSAMLCDLLTRHSAPCRLVVLNACSTSASRGSPLEPFGPMAWRLVERGVGAVVGHQAPVAGRAARCFAATFYAQLVSGATVDVAAQTARRAMFDDPETHVAWPFVTCMTRGVPQDVLAAAPRFDRNQADTQYFRAAFREQRAELAELIEDKRSFIAVVRGPERSGHRYVIDRIQKDLRQNNHVVDQPIPAMTWCIGGDARLNSKALLGAIAEAGRIPSRGTDEELKKRIAEWVTRKCVSGATLVLDVVDVCSASSEAEADAIVALVQPVWHDIVRRAGVQPTVLLLAVGYPPGSVRQKARIDSALALMRTTPLENTELHLLEELGPFRPELLTKFFTDQQIAEPRARELAEELCEYDNERALERLHRMLYGTAA
ncbi:MAG: CHAT domain-containing protein [Deltaproteobacteria bacterium]|nr:CHAT domain-containing protein [Deltaproteobacteria bacterium]